MYIPVTKSCALRGSDVSVGHYRAKPYDHNASPYNQPLQHDNSVDSDPEIRHALEKQVTLTTSLYLRKTGNTQSIGLALFS